MFYNGSRFSRQVSALFMKTDTIGAAVNLHMGHFFLYRYV